MTLDAEPSHAANPPCAVLPARSKACLRRSVSIGPLAIPLAALEWGISLSVHAAVAGVAWWCIAQSDVYVPPAVGLTQGDGGMGSTSLGDILSSDRGQEPLRELLQNDQTPESMDTATAAELRHKIEIPVEPPPVMGPAAVDWIIADPGEVGQPELPIGVTDSGAGPSPKRKVAWPFGGTSGIGQTFGQIAKGGFGDSGEANDRFDASSSVGKPGGGSDIGAQSGSGQGRPGVPAGLAVGATLAATYPRESRRRGEEGWVRLEVDIHADGSQGEIRVVEDPGYPRLVRAAIDAVARARFTPETHDGRATASTLSIPFNFKLRAH